LKRLTYEQVKFEIEKTGYKLLSNNYKNNNSKLKVECPESHSPYEIRYGDFQQGQRCFICYNNNRKFTYEFIKEQFNNYGYKLLSKGYKNSYTKLKIECPKGHQYEVTYGNF